MENKLIVIEGLDGCGKETQANLLCKKLEENFINFCKVSFPNYNSSSSELIKMYLNCEFGNDPNMVNAYAATSFFAVDRYASYIKSWKYKYLNGELIISDRYTTSNAIYQMAKLERSQWDYYLNWMQDYEYEKLDLPKPNTTIYLDMPIEISQGFMSKRYNGDESKKDLHESNKEFLSNCREAAIYTSNKLNWAIIKCFDNGKPRTIESIHSDIIKVCNKHVDFKF